MIPVLRARYIGTSGQRRSKPGRQRDDSRQEKANGGTGGHASGATGTPARAHGRPRGRASGVTVGCAAAGRRPTRRRGWCPRCGGSPPLGGRADLRLAGPVPAAGQGLRAPACHLGERDRPGDECHPGAPYDPPDGRSGRIQLPPRWHSGTLSRLVFRRPLTESIHDGCTGLLICGTGPHIGREAGN